MGFGFDDAQSSPASTFTNEIVYGPLVHHRDRNFVIARQRDEILQHSFTI